MKTSFLSKLFDTIAPRQCAICGRRLSPTELVLCGKCHLRLPFTFFERSAQDNPMARQFWGQLPIDRAAAWFYFDAQAETAHMIYDMKYHGRPLLARQLGTVMARQMQVSNYFDGIDALVPMPLTRRRLWQRGYNQSYEICRGISDVTGLPIYKNVVRRTSFAGSQTNKSAMQRRENVEHAFALTGKGNITGKHILLVDDIVTTGSTAISCGRVITAASGSPISILSLGFARS